MINGGKSGNTSAKKLEDKDPIGSCHLLTELKRWTSVGNKLLLFDFDIVDTLWRMDDTSTVYKSLEERSET
jgi:hypothetical protein